MAEVSGTLGGASRRASVALVVAIVAVLAGALSPPVGAEGESPYIVVLDDGVENPRQVAEEQGALAEGEEAIVYETVLKGYATELSEEELEEVEEDPRVDYVEPDVEGGIAAQTTPTGIGRIFAPLNSELFINEVDDKRASVDIAVLDTGIDQNHPDLNVVARTNCTGGKGCIDGTGTDGHSHGTHVAGTIAAIDNSVGVVGVAPGARLWSVKVVSDSGGGSLSEYIAGLDWVTARASQIEVANSSLRYWTHSPQAFTEAMTTSIKAGVAHVAAAGNENEKVTYPPAIHPDVIAVSAVADYDGKAGAKGSPTCATWGTDDSRAAFSNYGSIVDMAAPGVCILSTVPGNAYASNSGTSMASPHVAGAAGLLAGRSNPNSKADVEALEKTLEEEGNFGWTDTSGDGIKERFLDVSDGTQFSIAGYPPHGATGEVSGLQSNGAVLHGSVEPEGLSTTYQFEYGTSTAYGSKAPASPKSAGSGMGAVAVEESITGLSPRTTYHYRVVATNSLGTAYGEDRTFTTPRRFVPRFEAESYPATLAGQQDPGDPLEFRFHAGTPIGCTSAELEAQLNSSWPQLSAPAKYVECTQGESSATIKMNSCGYVLGVANSGPPYTGSLGISCTTPGDKIEVTIPGCVVKLSPQTVAGAIAYTVEGSGSDRFVKATISTKSLTYANTSGICVFLGPTGTNGELSGTVPLEPVNGNFALYLAGQKSIALLVAGEESAEPAKQPRFEAESHPASIAAAHDPGSPLKFRFHAGTPIGCTSSELDGQLSAAANQLSVQAIFTACTQGESSATIKMNSCGYVLGVANSGPPYTGSLGISCTTPGDAIEVTIPSCVVKLSPQTVAGAIAYTVENTGSDRFVKATISTKSLAYANTSGICVFLGSGGTNGELSGTVRIHAFS